MGHQWWTLVAVCFFYCDLQPRLSCVFIRNAQISLTWMLHWSCEESFCSDYCQLMEWIMDLPLKYNQSSADFHGSVFCRVNNQMVNLLWRAGKISVPVKVKASAVSAACVWKRAALWMRVCDEDPSHRSARRITLKQSALPDLLTVGVFVCGGGWRLSRQLARIQTLGSLAHKLQNFCQ